MDQLTYFFLRAMPEKEDWVKLDTDKVLFVFLKEKEFMIYSN